MKKIPYTLIALLCVIACKDPVSTEKLLEQGQSDSTNIRPKLVQKEVKPIKLSIEQANRLAELPLECISVKYPYKLGQTLTGKEDLKEPTVLHPAFYGCFDWHSAVHAHWSLVKLLKQYPEMDRAEEIKTQLQKHLSTENIQQELAYFRQEENKSFERTYGWAWLLKLAEEIYTWEDPIAGGLQQHLQPLVDEIIERYKEFLPQLVYPIRIGEHENTAFGLAFAYDYAKTTQHEQLLQLIANTAKDFYLNDNDCPIDWEPNGFDFFSPCLEEIDIMQRVLEKQTFLLWLKDFMPTLFNPDFDMEVAQVSNRKDGKLVHLDGLNYSRAWVLYDLAGKYEELTHLEAVAHRHVAHSFPQLTDDSYEGGHWLGTFAIYALSRQK